MQHLIYAFSIQNLEYYQVLLLINKTKDNLPNINDKKD